MFLFCLFCFSDSFFNPSEAFDTGKKEGVPTQEVRKTYKVQEQHETYKPPKAFIKAVKQLSYTAVLMHLNFLPLALPEAPQCQHHSTMCLFLLFSVSVFNSTTV